MNFLPEKHFTFKSNLDEEEVMRRLEAIVEGRKLWWSTPKGKTYSGKIEAPHFTISRVTDGEDPTAPEIAGFVEPQMKGSLIHIKIIFSWVNLAASAGILLIALSVAISTVMRFGKPISMIVIGLAAFPIVYLLQIVNFKSECRMAKNNFQELFEAEIVEIRNTK